MLFVVVVAVVVARSLLKRRAMDEPSWRPSCGRPIAQSWRTQTRDHLSFARWLSLALYAMLSALGRSLKLSLASSVNLS